MEAATIISILSLILAFSSFVYAAKTKIYELKASHQNDVLAWYSQVIDKLSLFRHIIVAKNYNSNRINYETHNNTEKVEILASIHALIERGMFIYPNDIKACWSTEKLTAYRGVRDKALKLLSGFYDIAQKDDVELYTNQLQSYEKEFTAYVSENLNPAGLNKERDRIFGKCDSDDM